MAPSALLDQAAAAAAPALAGLVEWNTLFLIARRQCSTNSRAFRLFNAAYWGGCCPARCPAGAGQAGCSPTCPRLRVAHGAGREARSAYALSMRCLLARLPARLGLGALPTHTHIPPPPPTPPRTGKTPTHALAHPDLHAIPCWSPAAVSFYPVRVLLFPALLPLFWREMQVLLQGVRTGAGSGRVP